MTDLTSPALRVATLADRALVRVSGPDWRAFLQGLLSQDVLTLAPGETVELQHRITLRPVGGMKMVLTRR